MKITTYTKLRQNLASILDEVHEDHQPLLVTRSNGQHAVVMSLEDFNAYQETLYLFSDEENANHLKASIEQLKSGKVNAVSFDDLEAMSE